MKKAKARRARIGAALGICALAVAGCGGGGGGGGVDPAVLAAIAAAGGTQPPVPPAPPVPPPPSPPPPAVRAKCAMDSAVEASYEERRLPNKIAASDASSYSQQLLQASGFDRFGPDFAARLCSDGLAGASSYDEAVALLHAEGKKLWQAALDRVQGRSVQGTLAKSDDRMLYWARLTMTLALRQWKPEFALTDAQRAALESEFERASRGQLSIDFPEGAGYKRILVSGFDPFSLGEPSSDDRIESGDFELPRGNPSGATILSLDGHTVALADGTTAVIRTFILPVNYGPFLAGMQEDTLGPWFKPGGKRVDASITMSQGRNSFDLEHYNGRYHFSAVGNDNLRPPCTGFPSNQDCEINPPERWLGYSPTPWSKDAPSQFTVASLPFQRMIDAATGDWKVARNDEYDVIECTLDALFPPEGTKPNPQELNCALQGGGGNYLSNASAYRNTLLRDVFRLDIPAGHIHTPTMKIPRGVTDPEFETHRDKIVAQSRNLVIEVARSLASPPAL